MIKIKEKRYFLLLGLFIIPILISSCSSKEKEQKELETVKVQLGWIHESQWSGFYAADKNGYYQEEGIKIELIPRPSPVTSVFDIVVNNEADFGTTNSIGLVTERSRNRMVKAIASIYQRDPGIFMSLEKSGIIRLEDFPGKKIRKLNPSGNGMILKAMMNKIGLNPDSMIQIETGYDMSKFYTGKFDICYGFLTNEVQNARNKGYAVNVIHPNGYGVNLYGMVIFTTDKLLEKKPEMILRFLRATIKGWQWAIDHPVEASALVMEYNPNLDKEQELRNFEAIIPLIFTGENHIGTMKEDKWQGILDLLNEQNLLINDINRNDVYTNEFMDKIMREEL